MTYQDFIAEYRALKAEYLRSRPECMKDGCDRTAQDIHHIRGRAGTLLLDWRYWVGFCRECHEWVGAHPVAARSWGFLCQEGQWNVPDRTPIPRFER